MIVEDLFVTNFFDIFYLGIHITKMRKYFINPFREEDGNHHRCIRPASLMKLHVPHVYNTVSRGRAI